VEHNFEKAVKEADIKSVLDVIQNNAEMKEAFQRDFLGIHFNLYAKNIQPFEMEVLLPLSFQFSERKKERKKEKQAKATAKAKQNKNNKIRGSAN